MAQDRLVYLVTDRPQRAERVAAGIAFVMPCRVLAYGEPIPQTPPAAWVIDCSLDVATQARWIDTLVERFGAGVPCLYLARDGSAREMAAIAQLRGPIVVSARDGTSGLVTRLRQAVAHDATAPRSSEREIETATAIVECIFASAVHGLAPSPDAADRGAEIVLATLADVGINAFLDLVWRHDITVYQHSLSVAGYAAAFAQELGLATADRHRLAKAALLHDVGKAHIPLSILNKAGPLDPHEQVVMRRHAVIGADLLAAAGGFEQEVIDVARWHHERLDGSGYPDGLKGTAIGDLVRLVAICDVHSALTERRVYREPMPSTEAAALVESMAGQLDPDLLRAYRPILECRSMAG